MKLFVLGYVLEFAKKGNEEAHLPNSNLNLGFNCQGLWQHEPDEKQVSRTEGQREQSWTLEDYIIWGFGANGKVGTQQRPHGESQREGDANHGLVMTQFKLGMWTYCTTPNEKSPIPAHHSSIPCLWAGQVSHDGSAEADIPLANASDNSKQ